VTDDDLRRDARRMLGGPTLRFLIIGACVAAAFHAEHTDRPAAMWTFSLLSIIVGVYGVIVAVRRRGRKR
jgi:hypothetical protein